MRRLTQIQKIDYGDCGFCGKKIKEDSWVKSYGKYFCDMKCINNFEDKNERRKI